MPEPMRTSDPAYWMLEKGLADKAAHRKGWVTPTHDEIYKSDCYICTDPEFALMGLPVCKPCPMCGVHWAADDSECDNGCDVQGFYMSMKEFNE